MISIVISFIGGVMLGHALMSLSMECGGLRDYRLWCGVVGLVIAIVGVSLSAPTV